MDTASGIIERANQIARVPGFREQARRELNSVLAHICRTIDFAAATAQFNFNFATNLVSTGQGNIVSAAPNPLPIDYLRVQTSGGATGAQRSSKWYIQGVAYDMIEVDITEFDDQVQQPGIQSYPYFWAKDMSQLAVTAQPTGDLDTTSTTVANLSSTTGIAVGMSIAGGIGPLSLIVPGTTITAVDTVLNTLTLSEAPAVPRGQASMTLAAASLMIGFPAAGYPYPPPSGAFPVMIRYQRLMPELTQAQIDAGALCWFPDSGVLVEGLAGMMLRYAGDSRAVEYIGDGLGGQTGRFNKKMAEYTKLADDRANRAQSVTLDRRRFGVPFALLPSTKTVGW